MLNKTTAAPENHRPWRWYRVGAPEEHLSGSVLLRSSTRVGAPEEPGSVLLRSWLLRSRVGDSQERPSPTYPVLRHFRNLSSSRWGLRCCLAPYGAEGQSWAQWPFPPHFLHTSLDCGLLRGLDPDRNSWPWLPLMGLPRSG